MSKARDIVRIDWIDSSTYHGWHNAEDGKKGRDLRCTSVGFLTENEPDHIAVANHIAWPDGPNPQVNSVMTIPRVAIKRIRKLGRLDQPPSRMGAKR